MDNALLTLKASGPLEQFETGFAERLALFGVAATPVLASGGSRIESRSKLWPIQLQEKWFSLAAVA